MDPWTTPSINSSTTKQQTEPRSPDQLLGFENSFISDGDFSEGNQALVKNTPVIFEKLPDSEEYLAKLEAKLGKLKIGSNLAKGKASKRKEEEGLVLELRAAREAALVQLVNRGEHQEGRSEEEISGEKEVTTNYLTRRLQPVQPVTEGEVVELTKSDSLAVNQEKEGEEQSQEDCEN